MKRLIGLLSISFVFINIFGVLIYFSFNTNFYIKHIDATQVTSSNIGDLKNVYSFLQNKKNLNYNFTSLESSHLKDVKNIFTIIYYIFLISLILFISISLYFIFSKKYILISKGLFMGSIFSLCIIIVLLLMTILDFTSTFQTFHKLFFPQGNREFAENSRLITLFPESFFISISQNIFITISAISIFIISIYLIIKKTSINLRGSNTTQKHY